MKKYVKTLTIYYETEISQKEIPFFRGAILEALGDQADILYHNHTDTGNYRYSYPLIQYKRINGKAVIVCVDKGVDIIGQLLYQDIDNVHLGDRLTKLKVSHIIPARILIQAWKSLMNYRIVNWIPLNSKNYLIFKQLENEQEKTRFLEKILKANILSTLKGLDIYLDDEIILRITHLSIPHVKYYKDVGFTSFNADFTCNMSIPNNIGIGKNASVGFGIIHQKDYPKTDENDKQS